MVAFPNCKINLGLQVLQKRTDGFHDLETVFYPIPLQDGLEIIQDTDPLSKEITITGSGLPVTINREENTCYRAWQLLKKDFPQLPVVRIHLHKVIPAGAGLGGGSADGAFTLSILNKKFNLGLTEERLIGYALELGSDCPFFILNKPCHATGRGEILEELSLDLSSYQFVLVNPGIHINTGWAFSQITPGAKKHPVKEITGSAVENWKETLKNDFEEPVFLQYPEIKRIKEELYRQGALYASMTGTGSTVYGMFQKDAEPSFHFPASYFIKQI
jgi:4-diphosphocytidyl-2-C-methyl-D-erythritol kinase